MRIRPEVTRAVIFLETRQAKARPFFGRIDLHHEEALVVAKRNIVTGPVFLDQLALEQQGFRLALHGVRFEIPNGLEHGARLDVGLRQFRRHEVGAHALAQVARFPDVDDAVEPIAHQVHARLVRNFVHFLRQVWFLFFRHSTLTLRFNRGSAKSHEWRLFCSRVPVGPREFLFCSRVPVGRVGSCIAANVQDDAAPQGRGSSP